MRMQSFRTIIVVHMLGWTCLAACASTGTLTVRLCSMLHMLTPCYHFVSILHQSIMYHTSVYTLLLVHSRIITTEAADPLGHKVSRWLAIAVHSTTPSQTTHLRVWHGSCHPDIYGYPAPPQAPCPSASPHPRPPCAASLACAALASMAAQVAQSPA